MPLPAEIHSPEVRQFLHEHRDDDPAQLVLQASRYPGLPVRELAAQVQAWQKARTKLPTWAAHSWAAHKSVWFPPLLSVEQSSSEATARFKASLVSGSTLVDLTGGMGVDAWAFSTRFERVLVFERNAELADLTRYNLGVLGARNVEVVAGDSQDWLASTHVSGPTHPPAAPADRTPSKEGTNASVAVRILPTRASAGFVPSLEGVRSAGAVGGWVPPRTDSATWLYLDPARRDDSNQKVVRLEACEPDVLQVQDRLLEIAPNVLLKAAPLLDLDRAIGQLRNVARAYVVAVENEVKELLFLLSRQAVGEPTLHAVNLRRDGTHDAFTFTRSEERTAEVPFAAPGRYLYEPNAALLKAGAFKRVAQHYGLAKLHPSSHLYTSEVPAREFPGRLFEVVAVCKPDKSDVRRYLPDGQANLTVRNFPMTVAQLRQKLSLSEGGTSYVFATTDPQNRKILVLCRKTTG